MMMTAYDEDVSWSDLWDELAPKVDSGFAKDSSDAFSQYYNHKLISLTLTLALSYTYTPSYSLIRTHTHAYTYTRTHARAHSLSL